MCYYLIVQFSQFHSRNMKGLIQCMLICYTIFCVTKIQLFQFSCCLSQISLKNIIPCHIKFSVVQHERNRICMTMLLMCYEDFYYDLHYCYGERCFVGQNSRSMTAQYMPRCSQHWRKMVKVGMASSFYIGSRYITKFLQIVCFISHNFNMLEYQLYFVVFKWGSVRKFK